MKSHASMNRIYRLVWNAATGLWVAVAETAKGGSKGGSRQLRVEFSSLHVGARGGFELKKTCRAVLLMLLAGPHIMAPVYAADAAYAAVVAGSGNIATAGNTTTINQASQRLAIDWTSLSTAANEALVFNQPNAQAIALNRIIGSSPSEMLGSLTANGQVFILNPNGVLFGAGSQVNVGGLVASTLNMSNADFIAGNQVFTGTGGSASVVNQGTLNAAPGGYLALLAPEVRNEGVMTASLGTALLAAGNKVTLNLDNGSLLGYSIDQGAVNALAENKQLIKADGGQVLLGAKALDALTTATVNNIGVIEAKTIQNKAGRILLMGDMETGTVNVGGTLDASAPDGGDGGFIETSAAHVKVASGTKVTTEAVNGKTGKWLIDPNDFTISAAGDMDAATVAANLATTDFEIQTATMGSAGSGDINVSDAVSWAGPTTFTLTAQRHVNINANLSNTGSGAAGFVASGAGNVNIASGVGIAATGGGTLAVNLSGASVNMASGSSIVAGGAAVTLAGSNTAVLDAVTLNAATINAGAGAVSITGNTTNGGSTTDWSARGVKATDSTVSGGNITLKSTNAAIQLLGTSVASAGGNVLIDAAGPSNTHSLEIAKNSATSSNVTTTGGGTLTLKGNLTAGGGGATGAASGVMVAGSTISAGSGAISISGDAGWTTTVGKEARGVLLASGATVTGAGNINLTGRTGSGVPTPASPFSAGLEVANGAKVQSTGAKLVLDGTFDNASARNGKGVIVGGWLESGPAGSIAITGSARVGDSSGTGVEFGSTAVVKAGTLGLTVTGTSSSSTTATNLIGADINGTVSSTGDIAITGTISAPSAPTPVALRVSSGTVTAIGAGNITLSGSGVPAPAPAAYFDVQNFGVITSSGGTITLSGDRTDIQNTVNAGAAGRIVIAPISTNRAITLGGTSETNALNLSSSELDNLTASVVQIGQSTNTGGIEVAGSIAPSNAGALSLLNSSASGPGITQSGGAITINKLNADARSVTLTNAGNVIGTLSGRSSGGAFQVTGGGGGAMTLGTVDGLVGVNANNQAVTIVNAGNINADDGVTTTGNVSLTSNNGSLNLKAINGNAVTLSAANGAVTDTNGAANNVTASTLTASSANGITLGTDVSGLQSYTTTGATGDISIIAANALNSSNLAIGTAAGSVQTISLSSAAGITVDSALGNAQDNFKLTTSGGNIAVNAALTANNLTLSSNGASAQTAAITANGLELLGTGSYNLNHAGNSVTTLAANTGDVSYSQAGALTIGTVNTAGLSSSGKVLVRTTGAASDLTLNNGVTSGSAANDSLVLVAGRNFINNAGAAPLNPGGGRYLVYATDPTTSVLGGLASPGNAFGRTYAANAPADASMTSLSGNRLVYSVVPTLNVSGDNKSKVYGGTDPALTYTVTSGLVAGDTVATALTGALSAPTGAATTGPSYAITQGTLAAALGYNVAYTDGTLTVTGTPVVPVTPTTATTGATTGAALLDGEAYRSVKLDMALLSRAVGDSQTDRGAALNAAAADADNETDNEGEP